MVRSGRLIVHAPVQVKPWLRKETVKVAAQPGVRLVDKNWQQYESHSNQNYTGVIRRLHRAREQLIVDREHAKTAFATRLLAAQRSTMTQLLDALQVRGFPNINTTMTDPARKALLDEITRAIQGELPGACTINRPLITMHD